VIRDEHRQQCQYDPAADVTANLAFHSTAAEWREACDRLPTCQLGRALTVVWKIHCSDEEWRQGLEPARERLLLDVCRLIASRTQSNVARPARLLGRTCYEAGVFLTIRSILVDAGADARGIAPSAMLAPYTRKYLSTFLGAIPRLSAGALPPAKISYPAYDATCWMMLASWFMLALGCMGDLAFVTIAAVLMIVVSFGANWFAARKILPRSVELGSLQTFRDLVQQIVAQTSTQVQMAQSSELHRPPQLPSQHRPLPSMQRPVPADRCEAIRCTLHKRRHAAAHRLLQIRIAALIKSP
jgi:hypothetical protein